MLPGLGQVSRVLVSTHASHSEGAGSEYLSDFYSHVFTVSVIMPGQMLR